MPPKTIKTSFATLAAELVRAPRRHSTMLLGIDGGGGAGKSTFARSLQAALAPLVGHVTLVQMDDFFLPSPQQRPAKDDFVDGKIAWQRLRDQVLSPLKAEQPGCYQRYDWPSHTLQEWHTVDVGGILIVEGIRALRRELAPLYDHRIWVECPRSARLSRGIARDGEVARARWELDWMPAEDRYIREHQPREVADLVVDGSGQSGTDTSQFFIAVTAR